MENITKKGQDAVLLLSRQVELALTWLSVQGHSRLDMLPQALGTSPLPQGRPGSCRDVPTKQSQRSDACLPQQQRVRTFLRAATYFSCFQVVRLLNLISSGVCFNTQYDVERGVFHHVYTTLNSAVVRQIQEARRAGDKRRPLRLLYLRGAANLTVHAEATVKLVPSGFSRPHSSFGSWVPCSHD